MPSRSHSETRKPGSHREPISPAEESPLADQKKWPVTRASDGVGRDLEILKRLYLDEQSPDQICAEMKLTDTQFRILKSRSKAFLADHLSRKRRSVKPLATQGATTESAAVEIGRIVRIVAHAVGVFGDEQKASHWLVTPLALLGNLSPTEVLAGGGDGNVIDQILTRIEHNIPS